MRIIVAFALLISIMEGEAVPINGDSTSTTSTSDDISELREIARGQVYRIKQEITALEQFTNEKYELLHQICSVRYNMTCRVDINTIRNDVTSLTQLLPVIQRHNETDEYIITKYNDIVKFMESSITALNNLIKALHSKDAAPADNNPQYEDLDEFVKLSILNLQVELTFRDLENFSKN